MAQSNAQNRGSSHGPSVDANSDDGLLPPRDSSVVDVWYLAVPDAKDGVMWRGPYLTNELTRMIEGGLVTASDRVWHPRYPGWTEAGHIAEFPFAPAPSVATPLPVVVGRTASPGFPSDALPLSVLGVICLCFVLHFASRLPLRSVAVASLPARPAPAAGGASYDLEICHRAGTERIYVAVAYYDPLRRDWMARGWFPQKPGDCQLTMRRLTPPVFVYAETADGKDRWSGAGDGVDFCIDRQKAFVVGQSPCREQMQAPLQLFAELPLTVGADGVKRFRWEIGP